MSKRRQIENAESLGETPPAKPARDAKAQPADSAATEFPAPQDIAVRAGNPAPAQPREMELDPDILFPSPLNPRHRRPPEGLRALALSLIERGQEQAIAVRPDPDPASWVGDAGPIFGCARGEIVFGTRRHAAFKLALAGIEDDDGVFRQLPAGSKLRAIVHYPLSDRDLKLMAADENLQQEDMDEIEEAHMFVGLRDEVTPRPGESWEYAVARLFPGRVAPRTVQRRRALLDCAEEVQQALIDKKITNAKALAFSMGPVEKQRALLPEVLAPDADWLWSAEDIKAEMLGDLNLPEADRALFDLALYIGEFVTDAESGERYCADPEMFEQLQAQAFAAKAEELRALRLDGSNEPPDEQHPPRYRWIDIDRRGWLDKWTTHVIRADDPDAGAVLRQGMGGDFEVVFPALRDHVLRERQDAAAAARRGASQTPGMSEPGAEKAPAPRAPLTAMQVDKLHEAKTQAMRRGMATPDPKDKLKYRPAIVAAILGLSGAREIRGMQLGHYEPAHERLAPIPSAGAEQERRAHLLKTAALPMHPRHKPSANAEGDLGAMRDEYNSEHLAAWFDALMQLPDADLMELFALTVAERVGSWVVAIGFGDAAAAAQLGDSALAVTIANATGADRHLPALWKPGRDWFMAYPKDRLVAIVGSQLKYKNADKIGKKGELADLCAEQPPGFWTPALFPELRYQIEEDAAAALAGPLPEAPAEAAE